jgi:cytochrome b pre-mRNA-processing protein 3
VGHGGSKVTTPTVGSLKVVGGFQKIAGKSTETYTAYGATEIMYGECAIQADYSIPQAKNLDEEMPKTEDGEDLGVGEGWWYSGTFDTR